jgi:hypothetical protein
LPIKLTLIFLRACCKNAADLRSVVARATCPRVVVISAAHLISPCCARETSAMLQTRFLHRASHLAAKTKSSSVPDDVAVDGAVERRAPPGEFITCNPAILAYLSPR